MIEAIGSVLKKPAFGHDTIALRCSALKIFARAWRIGVERKLSAHNE